MLHKNQENKGFFHQVINKNVPPNAVVIFYKVGSYFRFTELAKLALSYIVDFNYFVKTTFFIEWFYSDFKDCFYFRTTYWFRTAGIKCNLQLGLPRLWRKKKVSNWKFVESSSKFTTRSCFWRFSKYKIAFQQKRLLRCIIKRSF